MLAQADGWDNKDPASWVEVGQRSGQEAGCPQGPAEPGEQCLEWMGLKIACCRQATEAR
jgi:hypothetical protein